MSVRMTIDNDQYKRVVINGLRAKGYDWHYIGVFLGEDPQDVRAWFNNKSYYGGTRKVRILQGLPPRYYASFLHTRYQARLEAQRTGIDINTLYRMYGCDTYPNFYAKRHIDGPLTTSNTTA